jgi:hypothetical protein
METTLCASKLANEELEDEVEVITKKSIELSEEDVDDNQINLRAKVTIKSKSEFYKFCKEKAKKVLELITSHDTTAVEKNNFYSPDLMEYFLEKHSAYAFLWSMFTLTGKFLF